MTDDDIDDSTYDRAIEAAKAHVAQRAAATGIDLNVQPNTPDVTIAAMNPALTLDGVRTYLLNNEGDKFKILREGDGLSIAAAQRID